MARCRPLHAHIPVRPPAEDEESLWDIFRAIFLWGFALYFFWLCFRSFDASSYQEPSLEPIRQAVVNDILAVTNSQVWERIFHEIIVLLCFTAIALYIWMTAVWPRLARFIPWFSWL